MWTNCLPQSEGRWGGDLLNITTVGRSACHIRSDTSSRVTGPHTERSFVCHPCSHVRHMSHLSTQLLTLHSVQHSILNRLNTQHSTISSQENSTKPTPNETDFSQSVYFLLPVFSFSVSLPSFLKPLFLLSPSLFLCLDWASSFLLLYCLDSPNRSGLFYSLCLNPSIFRDVHRRFQNATTWCTLRNQNKSGEENKLF